MALLGFQSSPTTTENLGHGFPLYDNDKCQKYLSLCRQKEAWREQSRGFSYFLLPAGGSSTRKAQRSTMVISAVSTTLSLVKVCFSCIEMVHQARGLKKHLKRLNAPKHWMLDKLGGAFAPKPSSGPHKSRECLPLILILRNRLKYALTYREVISILMQRHVLVDGKVRTDKTYPAGFMDVVSIPKTNENFRLLYDTKGRFRLHSIRDDEAKFKLCKVRSVMFGQKGIPYLNTYDGRTIRYPDPLIKANDTIKLDLEGNKITEFIKFDVGNVVMVTGGRNRGRVGVIKSREKHKGTFETIHVQDSTGHEFATRLGNVFTIGKGTKPWVSLPKGKGIKLSIIEEARKRLAAESAPTA
ncbi:40S ribosomal protein S4-3 [Morella rubra]|uniref:40S ribosomal protein S4-3 n=1 Tax=Morella rubra TaxID=262757 RepID=A0A6A1W8S6_9ROSI|nr:40S ribosomal protein S4-3 [Morella rubra]